MVMDESERRTDLSDLVRERLEALRLSYRAAEEMSADPEGREAGLLWKRGTLENLTKGQRIKAPTPGQLRALAVMIQMPLRTIQDAAAGQFFEMDTIWNEDGDARLVAQRYAEMSEEDKARLRAIVESWGVKSAIPRTGDNK
jgi:hypothetical protein